MKLHQLQPSPGSRKKKTRVGRGNASKGNNCGRGMNGQNSRSGGGVRTGFEGGQSSFLQRMPKLGGFRNPNRKEYTPVSLSHLEARFQENDTVSLETLKEKRLVRSNAMRAKILASGKLSKKLSFEGVSFSASALEKVKKAGGVVAEAEVAVEKK